MEKSDFKKKLTQLLKDDKKYFREYSKNKPLLKDYCRGRRHEADWILSKLKDL